MIRVYYSLFCIIISINSIAQVGINTTTPSPASVLEVSSTSDNINYGGFIPPRVPTVAVRDLINPGTGDIGLMIFVDSLDCLQMWNGTAWEDMYCLNTVALLGVFQNFDLNTSWGYTSDVLFFDNGIDGFYGVTNTSNGGFSNIITLTNNFLGVMDLDDEGTNGTSGFATITFNTIDVSGATAGVTLGFDYEFFEFDNGDDAFYTVTIDGIPQTEIQLINGSSDLSLFGSVSTVIPAGTLTVGLRIRIKQNGVGDFAGFDNFTVIPN